MSARVAATKSETGSTLLTPWNSAVPGVATRLCTPMLTPPRSAAPSVPSSRSTAGWRSRTCLSYTAR